MGFNIYTNREAEDAPKSGELPPPIIEAGEVEALPPSVTEIAHAELPGGAPSESVTETKYYDCGCSATGPELPDYCPEHGTPPEANATAPTSPENSKLELGAPPEEDSKEAIEKLLATIPSHASADKAYETAPIYPVKLFPKTMYHIDGQLSSRLVFSAQEAKALGNEWTDVRPSVGPRQPIRWPASPSTIGAPDPKAKPKLANEFL